MDGCEVITKFPAEELLVAGQGYFAVDGPSPSTREAESHCNRRGDPMTVASEEPRVEELLELYERMALIRATEKAAFDLFMAGLVKGTTHLANGRRRWPSGPAPPWSRTTTCSPPTAATTTPSPGGQPRGLPGRADEPGHWPVRGQGRLHAPDRRRPQHARVVRHRRGAPADRLRAAWSAGYGAPARSRWPSSATGDQHRRFHEALNPAAVWRLPVLFVCENNLYMEYTSIKTVTAVAQPYAGRASPTSSRPR